MGRSSSSHSQRPHNQAGAVSIHRISPSTSTATIWNSMTRCRKPLTNAVPLAFLIAPNAPVRECIRARMGESRGNQRWKPYIWEMLSSLAVSTSVVEEAGKCLLWRSGRGGWWEHAIAWRHWLNRQSWPDLHDEVVGVIDLHENIPGRLQGSSSSPLSFMTRMRYSPVPGPG
jgi:hypothetical protein